MDDDGSGSGGSARSEHRRTRKRRFRKPNKALSEFSFEELRNRMITVQMDGVEKELTLAEALLHKTFQQALAGGRMATRIILKRILAHLTAKAPTTSHFPKVIYLHRNPQSVDEAMLILGIASNEPEASREDGRPQLVLEPWAAAQGLKRAKGRPRSDKEIQGLKRQIRDPESLVWPAREDE